ncbi:sigma 54-interacting transcriptional regulator [bacterium]|nr:sigma 54-interacting transcriptional regulator [bacterium]
MKVDNNEFFREATLRICGSLDIEKALWQCLLYIRKFMPVTQMTLNLYNREMGIAEVVAHATPEMGKLTSIRSSMPSQFRQTMEKLRSTRIWTIDRIGDFEGLKNDAKIFNAENLFCVVIDLVVEKKLLGIVMIACEEHKTFNQKQINLLGLLDKPLAIAFVNSLRFRELKNIKERLADESRYFQEELRQLTGERVVGADSGLKSTMKLVHQVSPLDSPVLLLGETGVGKEVIAGAIHYSSPRHKKPLIKVNCGAIPESLMDSELFGHEKGAFTGAISQKHGRFERAQGGTIFLDEIGELSLDAQVRLLRVIQEKEFERVGGSETVKLDIRVIAATHRNMEKMIKEGTFREDLYFRLNVFPITIPPLRDRIDDIPSLLHHFVLKKSQEMKRLELPSLAPGVIDRLTSYNWPGNIRELENAIERALILCENDLLTFDDIQPTKKHNTIVSPVVEEDESLNLDSLLANQYNKALKLSEGRVEGKGGAAERLGINPATLRYRMRKLNVSFGRKTKDSDH